MNDANKMTQWLNEYEFFQQDVNGTQWDSYDEQNQYYEDDNWSGYRYQ